jgi:hypothetical protein
MSKVMAHSSAVIGTPKELSFSMGLTYEGKFPSREIRDNYFLSDGGYVENLGLLSLVERGVDLIVLSDMGYPERPGDDLEVAKDQVKKLLKCEVTGDGDGVVSRLISTFEYACKNVPEGTATTHGTILYVRPYPENIDKFRTDLESLQPTLFDCIEAKTHECYGDNPAPFKNPPKDSRLEDQHRFPLTETFLMRYDERLIRSYYLLGKFVGENHVGPQIRKWLDEPRSGQR